jgi:serine/threonine-protein kinase
MVPESSPDQPRLVERFRREVSICTELSHPNILQVFGYGQTGGELYLAMENLVGNTMREWIGDTGMPIEHFASLFRQACGALGYAHDRGIVHRDIKPENIMVLSDGTVKIMDFGLAKGFLHSGLTMKGFTVGTPAYMAPEQIMSKGLDHRTDQYSLGVVAFEMITGRLPFVDEDVTQMMMMHIEAETPSPRLYRPDLSPALEEMILRMLEKEPTRRFYDMREVLRALDAAFAY